MSLERNETARRFMEALLHAGEPQEIAKTVEIAVGCTDTLIAALVPVAPATEPRRTVGAVVKGPSSEVEFIVVDSDSVRRVDHDWTGAKAVPLDCDTFVRWATREECERHGIPYVARPLPGAPLAAPSPAATPAAWVPKVGDVIVVPYSRHPAPEWTKVVVSVADETVRYESRNSRGEVLRPYGFCAPWECVFVRPATSSERAAAGLPVDASATKPVDREGLVAAMNKAARLWVESADKRSLAECHADAAIAFMAKGGA